MIPMLQNHEIIINQVSRELMAYPTKPNTRVVSLRKILKSVLPLIRFPIISRKDILTKVLQTKILTKNQLSQILIYKSFQEYGKAFDKPPIISFPIEKRISIKIFKQKSDFDENGVIFWMGTLRGCRKFQNPMVHNLGITVKTSSIIKGSVAIIVSRTSTMFWTRGTDTEQSSFISIDIGKNNYLTPSHYTLRHGHCNAADSLRNWIFEGSNDDINYYILSIHRNDRSLKNGWDTKTFPVTSPTIDDLKLMLLGIHRNHQETSIIHQIPGHSQWINKTPKDLLTDQNRFRYFRIQLIGPTSGGCGEKWRRYVTICGIELYGVLFTN